jgi:hypothetical protein
MRTEMGEGKMSAAGNENRDVEREDECSRK